MNCGLLSDSGKHCNRTVYYAIAYIASWACSTGYCSLLPDTSCSKAEKPLHTLDHPSRGRVCVAESLVSLVKVMRLHRPWASVYYLFNLPGEGNYPAFPYRVVTPSSCFRYREGECRHVSDCQRGEMARVKRIESERQGSAI